MLSILFVDTTVLSYACNTLADPWATPVGWTGSCPEVYYNFESLTPGSRTISLPNGGTHSTSVGYVSIISHSHIARTYVVFNIMSFAGKPLVKILFGPLQSYF